MKECEEREDAHDVVEVPLPPGVEKTDGGEGAPVEPHSVADINVAADAIARAGHLMSD